MTVSVSLQQAEDRYLKQTVARLATIIQLNLNIPDAFERVREIGDCRQLLLLFDVPDIIIGEIALRLDLDQNFSFFEVFDSQNLFHLVSVGRLVQPFVLQRFKVQPVHKRELSVFGITIANQEYIVLINQ